MSVLAWLFGLGALSVAFPFLFHLIRRTPTGQTSFSSLMFLKPSPPRLTRRSRLENWLLLLLRCGVLLALAIAFMRPFFRDGTQVPLASVPGRNVAILLDTSASMKRGELFADAIAETEKLLGKLRKQDRIAIFSFDNQLHSVVGFPETIEDYKKNTAIAELKTLSPSWQRGNLGVAIASAADRLAELNETDKLQTTGQIYVVSDFQKTSLISALQSVNWPANIKLKAVPITTSVSNASVQILKDSEEAEQVNAARVRIRNSEQSKIEQFKLAWDSTPNAESLDYYVPPKSSEIISLPLPEQPARSLQLTGDEVDFDNRFYFVQPKKRQRTVLILGSDEPDDPDELRYYFQAALKADANTVSTIGNADEIAGASPQMILVTDPVDEEATQLINEYLEAGGLVAFVAHDQQRVESYSDWIGGEFDSKVIRREKYRLLADIDFKHPMFAIFNSPGMNDFTGIKFWEQPRVKLDDPESNHIIAAFDDESPAIWSREVGNGKVVCFACGWQPEKSQLALSPKFVPIIYELVELAANERDPIAGLTIGQAFELDADWNSPTVQTPAGEKVKIDSGKNRFNLTDEPGIYQVQDNGEQMVSFAVNVDPAESDSGTLNIEQLEAYGVSIGEQATAEENAEQLRALKDTQLEDQQKIWKWAIILALGLVMAETFVASRRPKGVLVSELTEAVA